MTIALAPYWTQISGFGALVSINSREATFDGDNVVVELKAMPMPIPSTNTPPKIAIVNKLNMEDMELGDLGVVAVLPVDLRLIIAL
ncbi:hypothetical protein NSMS1_31200 [Nostoc sp. MS1]|nr:hypothetical protein NSMS1_31200 [Nostoc sp. MS1]